MAAIPKTIGSPRDWHQDFSVESERENGAEDQLLTVQEIAGLLRVPVSWVYGHLRKRCTDRLPAYRLGKYWRFRGDEVLSWVARHRSGCQAI
jgi:excisionase family DNA binding protein